MKLAVTLSLLLIFGAQPAMAISRTIYWKIEYAEPATVRAAVAKAFHNIVATIDQKTGLLTVSGDDQTLAEVGELVETLEAEVERAAPAVALNVGMTYEGEGVGGSEVKTHVVLPLGHKRTVAGAAAGAGEPLADRRLDVFAVPADGGSYKVTMRLLSGDAVVSDSTVVLGEGEHAEVRSVGDGSRLSMRVQLDGTRNVRQ